MNGKSINFDNKNIKKSDFYNKNIKIFHIDDIDVNKVLVSKKEQYGKYNSFKYFIGCNDNVIRPLYLFISQRTGYINKFEENEITMSLMVKDQQLLEKYNKIWKKTEGLMGIDFESKAIYGDDDDKYINTKIKIYKDSIITNFYEETGFKEVPEEKVSHNCLSIIILDSIIYVYEKYYLQVFLEECKYIQEKIKTKNYIDMELESKSDSDSDTDSDNGIYIDDDKEE